MDTSRPGIASTTATAFSPVCFRTDKSTVGAPLFSATGSASAMPSSTRDRKSTRLNSSHSQISHAVLCLKKKNSLHIYRLSQQPHYLRSPGNRQSSEPHRPTHHPHLPRLLLGGPGPPAVLGPLHTLYTPI